MKRSGRRLLAAGLAGLVAAGALVAPRMLDDDPPSPRVRPVAQSTPFQLSGFTVTGPKVYGGHQIRGVVTFTRPAPVGGVRVKVFGKGLTVPAHVKVKKGSRTGTFWIRTAPVRASKTGTVRVSYGKRKIQRRVTVAPLPVLRALKVSDRTLGAGGSAVGTVELSAAAQPGGSVVRLSADADSVRVPGSVRVPAGRRSASFRIKVDAGTAPRTVTLTAERGKTAKTAVIKIVALPSTGHPGPAPTGHPSPAPTGHPSPAPTGHPSPTPTPAPTSSEPVDGARVSGLIITPDRLKVGESGTGTVTLDRPAPPGGTEVTLVQFVQDTDDYAEFPRTVRVPAGQSSADFTVRATAPEKDPVQVPVGIRASAGGGTAEYAFSVVPSPRLRELRMPASAFGGNSLDGLVQLNATVDTDTYVKIELVSGPGHWVPDRVLVPAGRGYAEFSVRAGALDLPGGVTTATPLELRATFGPDTFTSRTIIHPGLASLTVDGPVKAGGEVSFTAKLAGPASSDVSVFVDSRWQLKDMIRLNGSLAVPAGQDTAVFKAKVAEGMSPGTYWVPLQIAGTTPTVGVTVTAG